MKAHKRRTFVKVIFRSVPHYRRENLSPHFIHNTSNKKQVCQQEKDQLRRVQVGANERRGQILRKEMVVETVNEWLLETLGGHCVEMLTRL